MKDTTKIKKQKPSKTKLEKFSIFLFVMTIIITVILLFLSISPIALVLFGLVIGLLYGIFVLVSTICTLGTIWVSNKTHEFANWINGLLDKCFHQDPSVLQAINTVSLYVIIVGSVFAVGGLVLDIIKFVQIKKTGIEKNPYKGKMIGQIVISSIFLVLVIIVVISLVN